MKLINLIKVFIILLQPAMGQISLEQTYDFSGTYVQLANSGFKFYVMDVGSNQCRIYNTDHTLWKTINLSVPADHYLYDIRYVSENLFTTDNSLCLAYIYYSYNATGQYYTYTAKVIKETGEELLSIPGCQFLFVHSLNNQSTKLTAYSYNYAVFPYTVQTHIYNLPGQLISVEPGYFPGYQNDLSAFPNPASDYVIMNYQLDESFDSGELILSNLQGNTVGTYPVNNKSGSLLIPTVQLPKGIYFYSLYSDSKFLKAGKLIVH